MKFVPGPDFPTGGVIVEDRAAIAEAYDTGRGGFRVRARWHKEDGGRGTWQVVITEIPWLVQKSRLVEKMAELFNDKKLPLVGDVRDESAEDIRLVIEPRARTVDAELMMESLFKLTELENRIPLNMNVLVKGKVPKVLGLAEALREWLDHRRDVLLRRSRHRLGKIENRLEMLGGFLVAYLNLDRVIAIIRTEDEPKPMLMTEFTLSDVQADAILNMRLRNLRRLEEMEIRTEDRDLRAEREKLQALLASETGQWKTIADEIKASEKDFRAHDAARQAPQHLLAGAAARRGGHRGGHGDPRADHRGGVAEGLDPGAQGQRHRSFRHCLQGQTTPCVSRSRRRPRSKCLVLATNGRFYTLEAGKLPGGRGHGEPVRLFIDLEQEADLVTVFPAVGGRKFLVASREGRGFVVAEDECIANTRKGKQVLNVDMPDEACAVCVVDGDMVATIGENRKLLAFGLDQVPEMARGRGVRLQRYSDGALSDVKTFRAADGLTWTNSAGRVFTLSMKELADWRGSRADAGRIAPKGFPRSNKFG